MSASLRTVEIECAPVAETDRAWQVDDGFIRAWLPKRAVTWADDPVAGVVNVATVDRRLAEAKGLV